MFHKGGLVLHENKGVNPYLTKCSICGGDGDDLVLVGRRDYKETCGPCGMVHYGGAQGHECQRCGSGNLEREQLEEHERLVVGPCKQCREAACCFFCGSRKDGKPLEPGSKIICLDDKPCPACAEHMRAGIILISVSDDSDPKEPVRTGGFWVVKEEAVERWTTSPELVAGIKRRRMAFMPDEVCRKLGLPGADKLGAALR